MSSPVHASESYDSTVEQIAQQLADALSTPPIPSTEHVDDGQVEENYHEQPQHEESMMQRVMSNTERISTLTVQCNARDRVCEGMETTISGLANQIIALTNRVSALESTPSASVAQMVNEAAQSTNTALELALRDLRGLISTLTIRMDNMEKQVHDRITEAAMAVARNTSEAPVVMVQPTVDSVAHGPAFIPSTVDFSFRP